jgi:hypothetical protein
MSYRDAPLAPIRCPRCTKPLPPLDVAACTCGTWVTAFAATEVLTAAERAADHITRWWKVRAPCPICGDKMVLRSDDPGHFQGCDGHGFWIDADAIPHTSLARGVDHEALARKRDDEVRVAADDEERQRAERSRAAVREDKERREATLRGAVIVAPGDEARRAGLAPPAGSAVDELGEDVDPWEVVRDLRHQLHVLSRRTTVLEDRIQVLERQRAKG